MSSRTCEPSFKVEALVSLISNNAVHYIRESHKEEQNPDRHGGQNATDNPMQDYAQQISTACLELAALMERPAQKKQPSPEEKVLEVALAYTRSVALAIALDLDLPGCVKPGEAATSITEIAQVTGASTKLIKNVMQTCADSSIFKATAPGEYIHTELSELLRCKESYARAYSSYLVDDGMRAGAYLPQTLREQAFQPPASPAQSAFCKAFGTSSPYDYYHSTDLIRGARFNRVMERNHGSHRDHHPMDIFLPFAQLPFGATVVDIGGGRGQNALRLAAMYPNITVIVQDHENVIQEAEEEVEIPPSVEGRIHWQSYDYFTPQPVEGADVYILSNILMDNVDSGCQAILACIAGAMSDKSKILICDKLEQQSGSIYGTLAEFQILSCFNTWSRDIAEWKELITGSAEGLAIDRHWEIGTGVLLEVSRQLV